MKKKKEEKSTMQEGTSADLLFQTTNVPFISAVRIRTESHQLAALIETALWSSSTVGGPDFFVEFLDLFLKPETWSQFASLFLNVIAYFNFPRARMTHQKRNKENRTCKRLKVSLNNAVISFTVHICATFKTLSLQVLPNTMQCKYVYKNGCFDFITIQSHSRY